MILSLLFLLQAPFAARTDPDSILPQHTPLHHDLTIVLPDTGRHILGVLTTTWLLRSDKPLELELDSIYRIVRVLTDGKGERRLARAEYALLQSGGVYIPHAKAAGDTLRTTIRYHGDARNGLIIRTDSAGRRTIFADNWPDRAHDWIPLYDHPSAKASVTLHVEAAGELQVVATGVLQKIDSLPRGRRLWHFEQAEKIPPYGIVIGAARLAMTPVPPVACELRCVPQAIVTFPEDSATAVDGPFRRVGDMVEFFSRYIGPFPYARLSHVQSTTMFGGMENPTAIFYDGAAYANRRLSEATVAHETAHQWFGDAVTQADWHHLWLSEGFATYFSALWVRHADGDSAFRRTMRDDLEQVVKSAATERPILDMAATDLMGLLNTNNYPKASWALHSLRGLIGDSAFQAGIRAYYQTYRDSTALSSDFAAVMSAAAGQDLTWYFTQALTQPGYPRLAVTWKHTRGMLILTVRQTQPAAWGTYRLPGLGLLIDGSVVNVDAAGSETVIRLPRKQAPRSVVVDPDGWWLLQATVERVP
ncbi:MAG: M1 family metallopeptidase [Gemmatimonadota bacterium]|mgnify:CR=1 FL=1|nr:M1 family metallopeptidase [Gemmatimonadota bacterium]